LGFGILGLGFWVNYLGLGLAFGVGFVLGFRFILGFRVCGLGFEG